MTATDPGIFKCAQQIAASQSFTLESGVNRAPALKIGANNECVWKPDSLFRSKALKHQPLTTQAMDMQK